MKRSALLLLWMTRSAVADVAAWHGYQSLGIPDEQVSMLGGLTIEGLRQGGVASEIVLDDAMACGSDVRCHCTSARKRGVRYAAFGSLGKLGDLWTIELTLVDTHACTVENAAYLSESIADQHVPARVIDLAQRVATPATEVSTTAVGRERTIDATPALVTTFTRSQLRALHIRKLDDLLPLVPGFEVIDANWGGLVLNQGLNTTLLVMSDGVPLVNGLQHFRWLDRDYRSSLVHVARVEVVRSPGAVLWGRSAFLGVVNLISDEPVRREASGEAGITIGSLDTEEIWGRASQNRGSYGFSASVDLGRRVGPVTEVRDSPQTAIGVSPVVYGNGGTTSPKPDYWFDVVLRLAIGQRVQALFQNQTSDVQFEISPRGPLLDRGEGGYWEKTHRLYALIATQPIFETSCAEVTLRGQLARYESYSWENFAVQPKWPEGPAPTDPSMRDFRLGLRSLQGNHEPRVMHQLDGRVLYDWNGAYTSHLTAGVGLLELRQPDSLATLTGIAEDVVTHNVSFTKKRDVSLSTFVLEELIPVDGVGVSAGARVQLDGKETASGGRRWRTQVNVQGGAVFELERFGAKLVYSEGFRPPEALTLYSTVGTKGNPSLVPERSQDLASELRYELAPFTLRVGGNLTRISKLILLVPIPPPSEFAYEPQNKGTIDVAGLFAQVQVSNGRDIDAFATYRATWLRESDPITPTTDTDPRGRGIPIARHTASVAGVWRAARDLSLFARGTFASPRRMHLMTDADPTTFRITRPTIRTMLGVSLANAVGPVDLDIAVDNPLFLAHDAPYQVDGSIAGLIERRKYTEVFATLRYEH